MRIRKHLRLNGLLLAADSAAAAGDAARLPSRICQLNQSPWDVLDSSWSHLQDIGEDSFAGGSFWNSSSVGATDSVDDRKIFSDDELIDISVEQEDDEEEEEEEEEEMVMCAKSYRNSWKCKSYAARSNSLCEYHLEKMRKSLAQPSSSTTTKRKKHKKKEETEKTDTVTRESTRRVRGRKATMSTNPYEFYYYSGFGPSWGKKRGAIATTKTDGIVAEKENVYSSSSYETDKIDFSDEEESGGRMGKRRGRKRIKARSLKSLM